MLKLASIPVHATLVCVINVHVYFVKTLHIHVYSILALYPGSLQCQLRGGAWG